MTRPDDARGPQDDAVSDLLRANLVRTTVPLLVGALSALLPQALGDAVSPFVALAVSGGYYTTVRLLEVRHPQVGLLLGHRIVRPGAVRGVAATPPTGTGLRVLVGERDLPGVESATWEQLPGQEPRLTLRLRAGAAGAVVRLPEPP